MTIPSPVFTCLRKRRFDSRKKAEAEIGQLQRERRRGRGTLYAYACDVCGAYHVSHVRRQKYLAA